MDADLSSMGEREGDCQRNGTRPEKSSGTGDDTMHRDQGCVCVREKERKMRERQVSARERGHGRRPLGVALVTLAVSRLSAGLGWAVSGWWWMHCASPAGVPGVSCSSVSGGK